VYWAPWISVRKAYELHSGHRLPVDYELHASSRCLAGQVLQPKAPGGAPKENPLLRPGQPGSNSALKQIMNQTILQHSSSSHPAAATASFLHAQPQLSNPVFQNINPIARFNCTLPVATDRVLRRKQQLPRLKPIQPLANRTLLIFFAHVHLLNWAHSTSGHSYAQANK
jgi:hypothetical protein